MHTETFTKIQKSKRQNRFLNPPFLSPKVYGLTPESGQALVELLVAISVLTVGFVGVLTLLARSLGLNRVVSDNYTATYLAAEGIEVIKNILDHNAIVRTNEDSSVCWNEGILSGEYEVEYDTNASSGPWPLASHQLTPGSDPRTLFFDDINKLFNYAGGATTPFARKITIATTPCSDNIVMVHALVSWTSRGGSYSVDLEDHFYNWR